MESPRVLTVGPYEVWFAAKLTMGLVYVGGAMFVLPPFTLSLEGATPGDVGIVMAVLPLVALGAPLVGGLLDRFGSFFLFEMLGLGSFAVGFVVLAFVDELIGATVGALILGVGAALVLTTSMSLMAGSGLPDETLNGRMSMLQMNIPLGQFLGLVVVAILLIVGADFSGIFIAMAVLAVVGLAVTALTIAPAQRRALETAARAAAAEPQGSDQPDQEGGGSLGAVLVSAFGLVLLAAFVGMAAHSAIETQYANFMSDVFRIDGETAAIGLAVAVLLSVPLYPVMSRWVLSAPYKMPLLVGIAIRGLAGLGLWIVADIADIPAIVPLALYGAIMLMIPLTDVSGALLAARTSPIGPGGGQGGFGFAIAGAGVAGAFVAGWAADTFGYRSVAMVVFVLATVGFVLGLFIPAVRAATPTNEPSEVTD